MCNGRTTIISLNLSRKIFGNALVKISTNWTSDVQISVKLIWLQLLLHNILGSLEYLESNG